MSERQTKAPTMSALLPSRLVPEDMLSEWQGPNLPNTKNYAPAEDSIGGMIRNALLTGVAGVGGFTGLPMSDEGNRAALLGELLAAGMPLVGGVKQLAKLVGAENKVAQGIKAYHGSPHDFDQFSSSKIGTGEGNQAYARGLYFAEDEGVARSYRDSLPVPNKSFAESRARSALMQQGDDPAKAIQVLSSIQPMDSDTRAAVQLIQDGYQVPKGRMYEVNIEANPEDFLDYDKPLSQQSKGQNILDELDKQFGIKRGSGYTGQDLHESLARNYGEQRAAEMLQKAGAVGMRYLDAGSRPYQATANDVYQSMGKWHVRNGPSTSFNTENDALAAADALAAKPNPTRNYVVFDDRLISIVKKYGIAAALSAGAINEMQARQMQAQGYQ